MLTRDIKSGAGTCYTGNIAELAAELPPAQVIVTSPPYWAKRRYSVPDFWYGGDVNCLHENTESRPPPRKRSAEDISATSIKSKF